MTGKLLIDLQTLHSSNIMSAEELRTELNHVRYQHDIYGKEYQKWHKEVQEKEKEYRKKLDDFVYKEMELLEELSKISDCKVEIL